MKIIEKFAQKQAHLWDAPAPVLAFWGDSVTHGCFELYDRSGRVETEFRPEEGYAARVQQIFATLFPTVVPVIVNAGISGDTAPGGQKRLERDVLRLHPDLVVVCYGLNDAGHAAAGLADYSAALRATLTVCALGIGYVYLNSRPASDDLFTAPVSDYRKTLWYTEHDVTALLTPGENVAAAVLGNGMYNEALATPWHTQHADWRDAPKLLLRLTLRYPDTTGELISDTHWRCDAQDSPYRFNQLRAGEVYDTRRPQDWMDPSFNDSGWGFAAAPLRPSGKTASTHAKH